MLRDENSHPDEVRLLVKDEFGLDECYYQPVIASQRKRIMLCLSLDAYYWAIYRLFSEIITVFSFGFAAMLGNNSIGNSTLLGSYVLFSCVAAPLWQFFSLQRVDTSEHVGCDHGCMVGMACVHLSGLCVCKNLVVIRDDKQAAGGGGGGGDVGWWSESLESGDRSCYSRSSTTTSINSSTTTTTTTTATARGPSISRYIPFSLYNLVYIISHEGRQELNPHLPYDQMEAFGMGRSILLCFGTSLRASLSLALVYNAYYALLVTEDEFFMYVSLAALASALTDLDVYLVAVFFGTILYPYTVVVWIALYFPMFDWVLNPKQGSFLFWLFKKYWKTVVSCVNVDHLLAEESPHSIA
jgi:hypothetical protein